MWDFLFGTLIRFLSGCKNAAYYDNKPKLAEFILTITITVVMVLWLREGPYSDLSFWTLAALLSPMFIIGGWYAVILSHKQNKNIHTAELLFTGYWTLMALLIGADWIAIIASAMLGNALFNMPIQYVTTGHLVNWVSATDDPTGKTLGYNLFGINIKVPRLLSNGYVKLFIGIILGVLYLINYFFFHIEFRTKVI